MSDSAATVSAYWAQYRLANGDRAERMLAETGELMWASEAVEEAVREGRPEVLSLLDALLAAPEADAGYIGAGPVEELLVHHGASFDDAIATRCRQSRAWRTAVGYVWLDDHAAKRLIAVRPFLKSADRG